MRAKVQESRGHRSRAAVIAAAVMLVLAGGTPSAVGQVQEIPPAANPTSAEERLAAWEQHLAMREASPFRGLPWRAVGPRFQGGRVEALAIDPQDAATMFVGVGAGNLWKTINGGTTWTPVFERESAFAVGDVAIAPSNPDVVWVGTGEVLMARSSYAGTGVFRSTDGGETWEHRGLADSHHIAKVIVHPRDPDTAWVAAIGHLFSFNEERGVFKTTDGGATWQRLLYIDDATGAIDLIADPRDPEVLYAAMWQHSRRAWGHAAAGATSGIYKSTDGGASWAQLDNGFPADQYVGRIGLAVAPSRPDTIYALVDNHTPREPDAGGRRPPRGEVYRSDDAGARWTKVSEHNIPAGYDFCLIRVSPDDPERVYVPGQVFWVSGDGGRSFTELQGTIVHLLDHQATVLHLDAHELWIDPADGDHWVLGNDGGVYVTHDAGANWLHLNNLPIAEFYAINVDLERPFNIYGGTQDDAAVYGPSTATIADGTEDPWRHVYIDPWGGGDSYATPRHPVDAHVIYYEHQFGDARRKDMRDGIAVSIRPRAERIRWPGHEADAEPDAAELPQLRNNWMTPLLVSHYDPDMLYYGTQFVLRSRDRGDSWEAISPDLTTDPGPERQGNVPFGTLTDISESPLRSGVIWTGSDDGRVHVTRDNGASWADVTGELPDRWISRVVASAHDPERAYVTLTGYREDDFRSYVYVSDDSGASWRSLTAGLPAQPVNVLREDPTAAHILYVGTDAGVYVSVDRGGSWHSLVSNLPTSAVYDLVVHPRDPVLVAGTHGRSAFVLDLEPVRGYTPAVAVAPLHLFAPRPAVRSRGRQPAPYRHGATSGEAVLSFVLHEAGPVTLSVLDATGQLVRTLEVDGAAGVNVTRWNLRPEGEDGPRGSFSRPPRTVEPGTYTIRLGHAGSVVEAPLRVVDP